MPLVNKPSGIKSIKNLGKIQEETYGKIVSITTTNENIGNLQKTVVFVATDKGYILKIS
ncbi:hypothetical protein M1770_07420 [Spiroplasma citri]|uniref:hypothetical protein n=1 Tax=Spiroplasma citri TaxID=2133 RepID=UPI0024129B3D|nr:hypothetical protein [Spiroplasma citri]WFG97885.1 hypothetical protein M1770_07420 [Spiroplasma citri]